MPDSILAPSYTNLFILKFLDTSAPRVPGLDLMRGIAILWVMLFHFRFMISMPHALYWPARYGWMGVDLFFVLSGYLIGSQLMRPYLKGSTPSLAGFYFRRAFRILPAYLTVLSLYLAIPGFREAPGLSPTWRSSPSPRTSASTTPSIRRFPMSGRSAWKSTFTLCCRC